MLIASAHAQSDFLRLSFDQSNVQLPSKLEGDSVTREVILGTNDSGNLVIGQALFTTYDTANYEENYVSIQNSSNFSNVIPLASNSRTINRQIQTNQQIPSLRSALDVTPCASLQSPANGSSNVTAGLTYLRWNNNLAYDPGFANPYDVYFGEVGSPMTLVSQTENQFSPKILVHTLPNKSYRWSVVQRSAIGTPSENCQVFQFSTASNNMYAPYCAVTDQWNNTVVPITRVQFAGIDNSSSSSIDGSMSQENFINPMGEVELGETYPLTIDAVDFGAGAYTIIYIDWNHNGNFEPAERFIHNYTSASGSQHINSFISNITIPFNASLGVTRVRIKHSLKNEAQPVTLDSCFPDSFGQIEDYSIIIRGECTPIVFFADADGDGFGNASVTTQACAAPDGFVANNTDCNDSNASVYPGAVEIPFNNVDEDCDGSVDEGEFVHSEVMSSLCGTTLSAINSTINVVNPGSQVTMYRYKLQRFIDGLPAGNPQIYERQYANFALTSLPEYHYNSRYDISVEVKIGETWSGYFGPVCTIYSPNTIADGRQAVNQAQCGKQLTTISDLVYTTSLNRVTGYRFRIKNLSTNAVQVLDRPLHWFSLNMLTNFSYGTHYSVEVAIKTTGHYTAYGPACTILAPNVPSLTDCGAINVSSDDLIYTSSLLLVNMYNFEVTTTDELGNIVGTEVIESPLHYFRLSDLVNYNENASYSVRVRVRTANSWSDYSTPCTINNTMVESRFASDSSFSLTKMNSTVYPNPYSDTFKLNFNSTSIENVEVAVYDMTGRILSKKQISKNDISESEFGQGLPSGVYNVVVKQGAEATSLRVVKR